MLKAGILLGDDIGLEVAPEAVKVMKYARGHPQGREPRGARGVRDRPHATAQKGGRGA